MTTSFPSADGPLSSDARATWLDAARGLAICGIAFMNVRQFAGVPEGYLDFSLHPPGSLVSTLVWQAEHLLADTKFITLFSLLFGVGLALQVQRGLRFSLLLRRLAVLGIIGAMHIILLWGGDILLLYAAAGSAVLLFRHDSPRHQAWVGILGISISFLFLGSLSLAALAVAPAELRSTPPEVLQQLAVRQTDYVTHTLARWPDDLQGQISQLIIYGPRTFGVMLLGMAAWNAGWLNQRGVNIPGRWIVFSTCSGLGLSALYVLGDLTTQHDARFTDAAGRLLQDFSGLLMLGFYLSAGVWLSQHGAGHPLIKVGRTALSCYLLQSLFFSWFFDGWGMGLAGQLTVAQQACVAAMGCFMCMILATFWLQQFDRGPLEQLWRRLTYTGRHMR